MVYLIFEILGFLAAAAGLGVVVGWLCRSVASPRQPRSSESRTRAGQREQEARRQQVEQLEARLAEAVDGTKALQEELAQAQRTADAAAQDLRKLEEEHRIKLAAREADVARLRAELESRRGPIATPLPPHTVSSPLTPGRLEVAAPQAAAPETAAKTAAPEAAAEVGAPPRGLVAPQGAADDLKRITGVGPSIERILNENGIFHYRQIVELTPPNLVWLDHHLRLKGRIEREDWIGQAKALSDETGLAAPRPLARHE